jgi:NDP-sugar pyrophosphorylase family protein
MDERRIQLVIPMAGLGQRFVDANYKILKPLIPIHGVPMIQLVIDNLMSNKIGHVILIAQRETIEEVNLREILGNLTVPLTIVAVERLTEGPADTVRLAKPVIDNRLPVVIANSDQFVNARLDNFYDMLMVNEDTTAILTMEDSDPKWSYVEINKDGHVVSVKEKLVISNQATVGIYGFSSANLVWDAFSAMWANDDRTNGEFYVAPSYTYLALAEIPIKLINLGPISSVMYGLGTPLDLESFIKNPLSKRVAEATKRISK